MCVSMCEISSFIGKEKKLCEIFGSTRSVCVCVCVWGLGSIGRERMCEVLSLIQR